MLLTANLLLLSSTLTRSERGVKELGYRRVRDEYFMVDANHKGFYKHVACPV